MKFEEAFALMRDENKITKHGNFLFFIQNGKLYRSFYDLRNPKEIIMLFSEILFGVWEVYDEK